MSKKAWLVAGLVGGLIAVMGVATVAYAVVVEYGYVKVRKGETQARRHWVLTDDVIADGWLTGAGWRCVGTHRDGNRTMRVRCENGDRSFNSSIDCDQRGFIYLDNRNLFVEFGCMSQDVGVD